MAEAPWDAAGVLAALRARDSRELGAFGEIVRSHAGLQEREKAWQQERGRLHVRVRKLQEEKETLIKELGERLQLDAPPQRASEVAASPSMSAGPHRVLAEFAEAQGKNAGAERAEAAPHGGGDAGHAGLQGLEQKSAAQAERIAQLERALAACEGQAQELQRELKQARDDLARALAECQRCREAESQAAARASEVARENQMLIERWTRLKLEEAERVNEANALYEEMVEKSKGRQLQALAAQQGDGVLRSSEAGAEALVSVHPPSVAVRSVPNAHPGGVTAARFLPLPRGDLVTCGEDGVVRLWQGADGRCLRAAKGSNSAFLDLAIAGDGSPKTGILAASWDRKIYHWDADTWQLVGVLSGHMDRVVALAAGGAAGSSAAWAASGSLDGSIRVWNLQHQAPAGGPIVCSSAPTALCFVAPDLLVSGHADGHLRQWDLRARAGGKAHVVDSSSGPSGGRMLHQVAAHMGQAITSVSLAPSGASVLTCGRDNSLKLFAVRSMELLALAKAATRSFQVPWDGSKACMSPSEGHIACGAMDGSVLVWSASTGVLQRSLVAPAGAGPAAPGSAGSRMPVLCCAWSPFGLPLVTGDKGGGLVWWK